MAKMLQVQYFAPDILLSHDGVRFVAQVVSDPGCLGYGQTYCEALKDAETQLAHQRSQQPSVGNIAEEPDAEPQRRVQVRSYVPEVKALLFQRYGRVSNRQLAAHIGLVERDAPVMLSSAFSGHGTRRVRVAIAVALAVEPSQLWPDRAVTIMQSDDVLYQERRARSC